MKIFSICMPEKKAETTWFFQPIWKWNRLYQPNTCTFNIRKLNNRPWSMGIEFDLCPVINFEKKCVYLTLCTVPKCYNVDDMCYLSIGWAWKYVVSMLKYMSHNDLLLMNNLDVSLFLNSTKINMYTCTNTFLNLYLWKLSKKYIE